jgi:hypothetical protein
MSATPKSHSPILHRLALGDSKKLPLFGGRRLLNTRNSISNDFRGRGQAMCPAPAIERQCRAVLAQQIHVQGLK